MGSVNDGFPSSKQIKTYSTWLFGSKRLQIKGKGHSLGLKTLDNRQEGFPSDILATPPTHPLHSPSQPLIKPARHLRDVTTVCKYYGLLKQMQYLALFLMYQFLMRFKFSILIR